LRFVANIRLIAVSSCVGTLQAMLTRTTFIGLTLAALVAGCSSDKGSASGSSTASATATNPAPVTTPYNPDFHAADFGGPIDNPYLPLRPGTVYRFRGVGDDGKTRELNTVAVTHRTKRIMGVNARVVLDQVFSGGKPEERTFDWYAQDNAGNVWYMGENSSNYEHGHWVKDDGSWTAGVGNGKPGVIMLAHPHRGDAYRQEYSPGHAVDQAKVLGVRTRPLHTPFRTFARTLVTREYSTIDKQYEKKFYARGVGVVREVAITQSKERSALVSVKR
jgi:hypothetical protein